jgi:hypothetical protein
MMNSRTPSPRRPQTDQWLHLSKPAVCDTAIRRKMLEIKRSIFRKLLARLQS